MLLVKGLNKYGMRPNIKKINSYAFIKQHQPLLKKYYIQSSFKDEYQLQATLVYLHSILNNEVLSRIYLNITNENDELWNSMSYKQRQVLLRGELMSVLEELPHFKLDNQLILLPCFNKELNYRFCDDYQFVLLKQNQAFVEEQLKHLENPINIYGIEVLRNGFCDFKWIKSFENIHYLYLEDFKSIYVFDQDSKMFINQCSVVDKYSKKILEMVELKEIVTLYHNQKDDIW